MKLNDIQFWRSRHVVYFNRFNSFYEITLKIKMAVGRLLPITVVSSRPLCKALHNDPKATLGNCLGFSSFPVRFFLFRWHELQPTVYFLQVVHADHSADLQEAHPVLDVSEFMDVLKPLFPGIQYIGNCLNAIVEPGFNGFPRLFVRFKGFLG